MLLKFFKSTFGRRFFLHEREGSRAAAGHERQAGTLFGSGKEGKPSRYKSLRARPARERIPSLRYTRVRFASTVFTERKAR